MPRLVLGLEGLGQHRLAVDGGHAEEGRQPHPEDGAGAAGDHGGGAAGDVACAHLGGDRGCHRLEGAHALLAGLLAVEVHAAEQPPEAGAEFAHLDEPGADGEDDAGTHQQIQQQAVPHKAGQFADLCGQQIHVHVFSLLVRKRKGPDRPCPAQQSAGPLRCAEGPALYSVLLPERFSGISRLAPSVLI